MTATGIVTSGIVLLLAIAVWALARRGREGLSRQVYGAALFVTFVMLMTAAAALLSGGGAQTMALPFGLPGTGVHLRIDGLSAFFLVVVNLGGAVSALYGIGYGEHEKLPGRVLPFFPSFIAAMNLVVMADDAFTFLVAWEMMSLTSWAMVMSNEDPGTDRAGLIYFVMASFSAVMLLFAFGLMAGQDGGYAFGAIRASGSLSLWKGAVVLTLVLLGAGSKAGVFPLHVWLPLAHPAAPSHVSALMSGVMTKVAVYGAIRILFDLAGSSVQWWWAAPVLIVAAITTLMGVLYALMQHDLKRLLAYHTVENIGIIFIGIGVALAFKANGMMAGAALAMTAAILHVFNHSLFKSLLFLGSGAVLHATGERDIDHLGGLIHKMPVTAFLFLAGSAAISALPPLNGFVSEWLTFQSILASPVLLQDSLRFLIPVVGGILALSAALAAACFVKAFGVTFLGLPRTPAAERARETDGYSLLAMAILAAGCLLVGVFPSLAAQAIQPAVDFVTGAMLPAQGHGPAPLSLTPFASGRSSYNGMIILIFLLISGGLTAWAIHRFASREMRRGDAWDCGTPGVGPVAQYTAASFSQPIRRVFGTYFFAAREEVDMPKPGEMRPARFAVRMMDPAWRFIFTPLSAALDFIVSRIDILQRLTIRRFLMLVFVWVVILLIVVAAWH